MKTPSRLLLTAVCLLAKGLAAAEKPNIVVFLVDDMGLMDTSLPMLTDASGKPQSYPLNAFYRTPNMERLAAQGIRFSTFYSQSVCSPTRISLLTGQSSARHRTTNWINPEKNNGGTFGPKDWNWSGLNKTSVTLPRLLQAAGYRTIHIGKGHFGPGGSDGADPRNLGFDVNIAGGPMGHPASYYGEKGYGNSAGKAKSHAVQGLEKYHGTHTFLTEALTLEAKDQIAKAHAEHQPFFLYLPHYAVHAPHQSDPRFAAHYLDSGKSAQAQAFATLIEGMDKSLGDLLDHVNQLGIGKETLFVFFGDNGSDGPYGDEHGYSSSAPLRGKKGTCYEGGTRAPFIAAWAQPDGASAVQTKLPIAGGQVQRQLATVMDIFPTLLDLANVAKPAGHPIDGVSLANQFRGERNPARPERFLSHFPHDHRSSYFTAYREGDWKVIYRYLPGVDDKTSARAKQKPATDPQNRYELYNLARDPFERDNLADREPAQLKVLMQALAAQLAAEQALVPVDASGQELRPVLP